MITRTFVHVPGVGRITEQALWDAGVRHWDDLAGEAARGRLGRGRHETALRHVEHSRQALAEGDWMFLYNGLPPSEQWRVLTLSPERTAYLDIETTGPSRYYNEVTCIGLYDGTCLRNYVSGQNLEQFCEDIEGYDLLVTYNGKCFDVPFLRHRLHVRLDVPHVDLLHACRSVGLKGGLKAVERQAGLHRAEELDGVDGWTAVLLWHEYEATGDQRALDTLIAYNLEDVINLRPLAQIVWNRKLPREFPELAVPVDPGRPPLPVKADRGLIERLLAESLRWAR